MEARALTRLAASHAVSSAVQAVDLVYIAGGASSIYVSCPVERAFRDVHIMTQHIGVHPRVMHSTGRVLSALGQILRRFDNGWGEAGSLALRRRRIMRRGPDGTALPRWWREL